MRDRLGVSLCAVAAAVFLAACGGGGEDTTDPATLVPSDVPLYFRADLRPQGEVRANTENLVETISGKTVGDLIDELVAAANASSQGKEISFDQDVDPWLGEKAGVFVTDIAADSPTAAAVIETTDEGATQGFIDKAREPGDQDRKYEGTDYLLDGDTAVGVVDGFLVIGNEQAFKSTVDVSGGDDSLAGNDDFNDTIDGAPEDSLVDAYVALGPIVDAIEAQGGSANSQALQAVFGDVSGKSALASVVPGQDSIEVDQRTDADFSLGFAPGDVSELIGSFPADSFAALGVPDIGDAIEGTLNQLESSGVPGVSRDAIDQQLSAAGLSVDEITSNLEDLGLFVGGTDQQSLEGALVITVSDPAKAEDLVGTFSGLAVASGEPGIKRVRGATGFQVSDPELGPKPGVVLVAGNRIAVGYGAEATEKALDTAGAGDRLADDSTYKGAVAALGGDVDVSAYFAVPPILKLAESLGANSDYDYQQAKPYLGKFGYLIVGSGKDGDTTTSKIVLGVQG